MFNRPLVVLKGSIAAYDFNLDFGCCFGTYQPPKWEHATPGAGIASSGEILLQQTGYRTLLIEDAQHVRFYAHNTEQDFGDTHTEISRSYNVTFYGANLQHFMADSPLILCYVNF